MTQEIDKELIDPPVEPASELAHLTMRAALSAIPVLGGPVLEIFNSLITPPMERRRTAWMVSVTEAINELLENRVTTMEELVENEDFFTTLIHASGIAIKNHEQEKLNALKAIVANTARPGHPREIYRNLSLNLIDTGTTWHMALIRFFHSPQGYMRERGIPFPEFRTASWESIIEYAIPELRGQHDIYRGMWQELLDKGFINIGPLADETNPQGLTDRLTSELGEGFLSLVSERT